WSLLEAVPALLAGMLVAAALDRGFLAGRPLVGLGWLGLLGVARLVGAVATRRLYPWLGGVVGALREPPAHAGGRAPPGHAGAGLLAGMLVAAALDGGFLAGRPLVGLGWLGLLGVARLVGAVATRRLYPWLGELVEPLRDALASTVVRAALAREGAAGPGLG